MVKDFVDFEFFGIIDGDGHFFEQDRLLYPYLAAKYKPYQLANYYLFPDLDGQRRLGRGAEWGTDDATGCVRTVAAADGEGGRLVSWTARITTSVTYSPMSSATTQRATWRRWGLCAHRASARSACRLSRSWPRLVSWAS